MAASLYAKKHNVPGRSVNSEVKMTSIFEIEVTENILLLLLLMVTNLGE